MKTKIYNLALSVFCYFLFYTNAFAAKTLNDLFWEMWAWWVKPSYLVDTPVSASTADWLILSLIAKVIDIILYFAWTIAIVIFIIWGFQLIVYFWSEENEWRAKKLMINAAIWLVIVIVSVLIVDNIERFVRFLLWDINFN